MTWQEMFDKAVAGLASQGFEKSTREGSSTACMYRGTNGRRCAVGWLIPDELYHESMEGKGIIPLATEYPYLDLKGTGFLMTLQQAHDDSKSPEDMKLKLLHVAKDFELNVTGVLL